MRSAHSASNSAIENDYFYFACICRSLGSIFPLLCLSVTVSGYIITHCMSIYVSPLCFCVFFSLNICISVGLYCHWLYVYICTSLVPCGSLTFSLWIPLSVFGYIVTDCTCIGTSLHLSLSLCQFPGILLVNLRVYVRLLIGISLSLFVSECVKQCPTILSLIVVVSQCRSLDSCCSLSFLSEGFYPWSAILSLIARV